MQKSHYNTGSCYILTIQYNVNSIELVAITNLQYNIMLTNHIPWLINSHFINDY